MVTNGPPVIVCGSPYNRVIVGSPPVSSTRTRRHRSIAAQSSYREMPSENAYTPQYQPQLQVSGATLPINSSFVAPNASIPSPSALPPPPPGYVFTFYPVLAPISALSQGPMPQPAYPQTMPHEMPSEMSFQPPQYEQRYEQPRSVAPTPTPAPAPAPTSRPQRGRSGRSVIMAERPNEADAYLTGSMHISDLNLPTSRSIDYQIGRARLQRAARQAAVAEATIERSQRH